MLPVRPSRIRSPRFPTRAHPRPRMTPALSTELRVSHSSWRSLPAFLVFPRLRQAACAFPQVPLDLHAAHGDEFQIHPNFASLALPGMSARHPSNLCFGGLRAPMRISALYRTFTVLRGQEMLVSNSLLGYQLTGLCTCPICECKCKT